MATGVIDVWLFVGLLCYLGFYSVLIPFYVEDYRGIIELSRKSIKTKQLGAKLIPSYFKFFTSLSKEAFAAYMEIIDQVDGEVRAQAIRDLPLLCRDTPEFRSVKLYVLPKYLNTEEEGNERDAVHEAFMSLLLEQDKKASLTALFETVPIRKGVLHFIRDKVFPLKEKLLEPQEEMERHITDLIKQSLGNVRGEDFNKFIDFLKSLSIFGDKAPQERVLWNL